MSDPSASDNTRTPITNSKTLSRTPITNSKTLSRWIVKKEEGRTESNAASSSGLAGTTTANSGNQHNNNGSSSSSFPYISNTPLSGLPVISPSTTSTITDDDRSRMSTTDDILPRIDIIMPTNNNSMIVPLVGTALAATSFPAQPTFPHTEDNKHNTTTLLSSTSSSIPLISTTDIPSNTASLPQKEEKSTKKRTKSATSIPISSTQSVNDSNNGSMGTNAGNGSENNNTGIACSTTTTTTTTATTTTPLTTNKTKKTTILSTASKNFMASFLGRPTVVIEPTPPATTLSPSSSIITTLSVSVSPTTENNVSENSTDALSHPPIMEIIHSSVPVLEKTEPIHLPTATDDVSSSFTVPSIPTLPPEYTANEIMDTVPSESNALVSSQNNNHETNDAPTNNNETIMVTDLSNSMDSSIIEIFDTPNNTKHNHIDQTRSTSDVSIIHTAKSVAHNTVFQDISAPFLINFNIPIPHRNEVYIPVPLTNNSFGRSASLSQNQKQWRTIDFPVRGMNHSLTDQLISVTSGFSTADNTLHSSSSTSSTASSSSSSISSLVPNFSRLFNEIRSLAVRSTSANLPVKVVIRPSPLPRQYLHRLMNTPSWTTAIEYLYEQYKQSSVHTQQLNLAFSSLYSDSLLPSHRSSAATENITTSSTSISVTATPVMKGIPSSSSSSSLSSTPHTPVVTGGNVERVSIQSIHQSLQILMMRSLCDDTSYSLGSSTVSNPSCTVVSSLDGSTHLTPVSSTVASSTFDSWWPYKYRPLHSSQVCGNTNSVNILCTWLAEFRSALALPEDEYAKLIEESIKKKQQAAKDKQRRRSRNNDGLFSSSSEIDDNNHVQESDQASDSEDIFSEEIDGDESDYGNGSDESFDVGETKKRHRDSRKSRSKGKNKKPQGKHGVRNRVDSLDPDFIGSNRGIGEALASLETLAILVGPTGSGKTAAVYACAAQLGYGVIEVHPEMPRSKAHLLDQLREATQSRRMKISGNSSSSSTNPSGGMNKSVNTLSTMFNSDAVKSSIVTKHGSKETLSKSATERSKPTVISESESEVNVGGKNEGKAAGRKKKSTKESKVEKEEVGAAPPRNTLFNMLGGSTKPTVTSNKSTTSSTTVPTTKGDMLATGTANKPVPTTTPTQSSITSMFKSAKSKEPVPSPLSIVPLSKTVEVEKMLDIPIPKASVSSSSATVKNSEEDNDLVRTAGSFLASVDKLKATKILPVPSLQTESESTQTIDLPMDVPFSGSTATSKSTSQLFSPNRSLSMPNNGTAGENTAAVSLILFEAGDVIFPHLDKHFLLAVRELAAETRCPIIITMNTLPLSPLYSAIAGFPGKRLLFYRPLPCTLELYLSMVAIAEGKANLLPYIETIVLTSGCDIRYSLSLLQLWYNHLPVVTLDQMDPTIRTVVDTQITGLDKIIQQARQIEDGTWQVTQLPSVIQSTTTATTNHGTMEVDLLTPQVPRTTMDKQRTSASPIFLNLESPATKESKSVTVEKETSVRSSPAKRSSTSMETDKDSHDGSVIDASSSTVAHTGRPRRQAASTAVSRLQEQAQLDHENQDMVGTEDHSTKKGSAKENTEGTQPSKRKRTTTQKEGDKSSENKPNNDGVVDLTTSLSPVNFSKKSITKPVSSINQSYSMILRNSTVIEAEKVAQSIILNVRTGAYTPTVFLTYPATIPLLPVALSTVERASHSIFPLSEFHRSPSLAKPLDYNGNGKGSKQIMVFGIESDVVFLSDLLPKETNNETGITDEAALDTIYATFVIRGSGFRPNRSHRSSSSSLGSSDPTDRISITIAGIPLPSSCTKIKSNGVLIIRLPLSWLYLLFDTLSKPSLSNNPYTTLEDSYYTYLLAPRKPKDINEALMNTLNTDGISTTPALSSSGSAIKSKLVPVVLTDLGITINEHEVYFDRRLMFVKASYTELAGSNDLFHTLGTLLVRYMRGTYDGSGSKGDRSHCKHKTKKSKLSMEPITTVVGVGIKRLRKIGGDGGEDNLMETVNDIEEISTPKVDPPSKNEEEEETKMDIDSTPMSSGTPHGNNSSVLPSVTGKKYPNIIADDDDDEDIVVQKRNKILVPLIVDSSDKDEGSGSITEELKTAVATSGMVVEDGDGLTTTDADNEIEKEEEFTVFKVPDPWIDIVTDNEDWDNEFTIEKTKNDDDDDINNIPLILSPSTETSTDSSSIFFTAVEMQYLCRYLDTLSTVDILSVPHGIGITLPTVSQGAPAPALPILLACTRNARGVGLYEEADLWESLLLRYPDNIGRLQTEWNGCINSLHSSPGYLPYDIFTEQVNDDTVCTETVERKLHDIGYNSLYHNYGQSRNYLNYGDGELEEGIEEELGTLPEHAPDESQSGRQTPSAGNVNSGSTDVRSQSLLTAFGISKTTTSKGSSSHDKLSSIMDISEELLLPVPTSADDMFGSSFGNDIKLYSPLYAENVIIQDKNTYQQTIADIGSFLTTCCIRTMSTLVSSFSFIQHYYEHLFLPLNILKLRHARTVPWTGILRSIIPSTMLHARAFNVSGGYSSSLYACQGSEGINAGLDRLSTIKYIAVIEQEQYNAYQNLLQQYHSGALSSTMEPSMESSVGRRTRSSRRQAQRIPLPPDSHLQNHVGIELEHTEILRILLQ